MNKPRYARRDLVLHIVGRTRLIAGAALALAAYVGFGCVPMQEALRTALSWDLGLCCYLLLSWVMMWRSETSHIERRARALDVSLGEIVILTGLAASFSLFAAARVLGVARNLSGGDATMHLVAGIGTIVLSWFFVHTLFAIHYAHEYHDEARSQPGRTRGGLTFPGGGQPDYWDFGYFASVIAMTCQVSDVSVESRDMRHLVTAHGVISFFLNTVIVALAVGIAVTLI